MEPATGDTILFSESASHSLATGKFIATIFKDGKVLYLLEMPDGALLQIARDHCTVHRP